MHRNSQIARRTSQTTNGSRKSPGTVFFVWVWLWVPRNFACGEGWWFREILRAKFCGMVGPVRIGKGFRLLTAFAAEWWGSPEGIGEMGGEGKESGNGTPHPAAHLPLFSPRLRRTIPRNAPALSGIPRPIAVARSAPALSGILPICEVLSGSPHCGFALCGVSTELLYLRDCLGKVFSLKSYVFLPAHLKHQRFLEISGDCNLTKKTPN